MGKVRAIRKVRWTSVMLSSVLAVLANGLQAADSTSEVFVTKATVIKGNGGSADPRVNYISVPVQTSVVYSGTVTDTGAQTIYDNNATWTPNQFDPGTSIYYIEFDSGVMADITDCFVGNVDRFVRYPGTLAVTVQAGDKYRIRKHLTLADALGRNNQAGLRAGSNPNEADNILIHNPDTQQTRTFFYSSVSGFEGWYEDNYAAADNVIIYPEQGLMVLRKISGDVTFYINGRAREGVTKVPVHPGFNLVGTIKGHSHVRLDNLGLHTGSASTGFAAGNNPTDGDNLIVMMPDASTETYFYSNFPGFEGWFDAAYSPADNLTIAPGSAFFIHRKNNSGLFYWNIPAE